MRKKVGEYRITKLIGAGGFGQVYEATHGKSKQKFAVKVLPAEFLDQQAKRNLLHRELTVATELRHPNIVRVFELIELPTEKKGEREGYLVMELIEGHSLRRHVVEQDLSLRRAVNICLKVCAGLFYIHSHRSKDGKFRSVIHRDIKPENILISNRGEVKITDFGLSVSDATRKYAKVKNRSGTPKYMAPEQLLGKKADVRADIYAFGVTMYELFTGKAPYGGSEEEIIRQQASPNVMPPLPSKVKEGIPPRLDRVIMKALLKDPKARYQNVYPGLQKDLERAIVSRI